MAISVGVGVSNVKNSYQAANEAAQKALKEMKGEHPDFVLVFSTDRFDQKKMIEGIRAITGEAPLVGCCGAGLISKDGLSTDSIAVLALKSDVLQVKTAMVNNISQNPRLAGEEVAKKIMDKEPVSGYKYPPTLLMLPDGLTCNVCELVRGVYEKLGPPYQLVGGGAGDNVKFIKTHQFIDSEVYNDAISVALITSEVPIGIGVGHGWSPVGRPLVVTKSEGKIIREIEGRPAFEAYLDYFGDVTPKLNAENFPEFGMRHPLGLPDVTGGYTIRDPLKVEKDGSIICVAEVPENSAVRIMKGDNESVIRAAKESAQKAVNSLGKRKPAIAIVFDCVSRLLLLGKDAQRELDTIRSVIGRDVPLIGFFTFGEIASANGGPPVFHNKTVVVCVIAS
ncbi:MAG: FIST signal transduction protein [Candidatus Aminicenantia bacterium]